MARDEAHDAAEKRGLSDRMLKLIETATVEERRKASNEKGSGPEGEQRRRTDASNEPEKRAG